MAASKLSSFIRANIEPILEKWVQFANEIPSTRNMDMVAVRDHASGILHVIADDLDRSQTSLEQSEKSKGHGPTSNKETQAEKHGVSRMMVGFSVMEMMSEFRALRASVTRLWINANPTALQTAGDDLIRFNEAIDQALTESLARYSLDKDRYTRLFDAVLSSSPDLTGIFDVDGRFIYANKSMVGLYNLPLSEIVGKNFFDLGASFAPEIQKQLQHVVDTKRYYRGEISDKRATGETLSFEFIFVPVINEDGDIEAVAGTARDVTERKVLDERLSRSANYDLLTDLPNRSFFLDQLDREIKRSARNSLRMALFFLDLDGFKDVNDRLGHDAGDQLLQQVAQRISACVRDTDMVARMGGDEFTVILADVKERSHVEIMARKILDALATPFSIFGKEVHISGSIGITLFPQDATVSNDLIKNADQAMYVAKQGGRNRFHYFTLEMQQAADNRARLIDDLHIALKKKQLLVHYQPIVELETGETHKAEALVRWQHPVRGMLSPEEFIPLAEETGMIVEIGDWIFRQVAQQVKRIRKVQDPQFQISVNKSAAQFRKDSILNKTWVDYLQQLNLPGDSIVIEIAESLLMDTGSLIQEKLSAFHRVGMEISLDDFGTGFSSLSYLKDFGLDYVKIDQAYIHNLLPESHEMALCEAIIEMAHKLGIKVIAEGVETKEQCDLLTAAGCDYAQGYLFSKPIPSEEFENLLKAPAYFGQGNLLSCIENDQAQRAS